MSISRFTKPQHASISRFSEPKRHTSSASAGSPSRQQAHPEHNRVHQAPTCEHQQVHQAPQQARILSISGFTKAKRHASGASAGSPSPNMRASAGSPSPRRTHHQHQQLHQAPQQARILSISGFPKPKRHASSASAGSPSPKRLPSRASAGFSFQKACASNICGLPVELGLRHPVWLGGWFTLWECRRQVKCSWFYA